MRSSWADWHCQQLCWADLLLAAGQPQQTQPEDGSTSKVKGYDLRYRPNIYPLDRYTDPGQYPKGTQGHYVPWQTLDLAGLVARFPDVHEGAIKWIRAFEEETVGMLLAVGDIKALWAQCFGAPGENFEIPLRMSPHMGLGRMLLQRPAACTSVPVCASLLNVLSVFL